MQNIRKDTKHRYQRYKGFQQAINQKNHNQGNRKRKEHRLKYIASHCNIKEKKLIDKIVNTEQWYHKFHSLQLAVLKMLTYNKYLYYKHVNYIETCCGETI